MEVIKNNFLSFIIILLLAIVLIGRCSGPTPVVQPPLVTRDTVWVRYDSIIYKRPYIVKRIRVPIKEIVKDVQYIPDTNYDGLVKQYRDLLILYFAKNIQRDTLKINKFGYVYVQDTVNTNVITSRSYNYKITYPIVKENTTVIVNKNQLYLGGGLGGDSNDLVNQINAGVLLKTKNDQILGATIGLTKTGQVQYNLNSYWKLRVK